MRLSNACHFLRLNLREIANIKFTIVLSYFFFDLKYLPFFFDVGLLVTFELVGS